MQKNFLLAVHTGEPQRSFRVHQKSQLKMCVLKGILSFCCVACMGEVQETFPSTVTISSSHGKRPRSCLLASSTPSAWSANLAGLPKGFIHVGTVIIQLKQWQHRWKYLCVTCTSPFGDRTSCHNTKMPF